MTVKKHAKEKTNPQNFQSSNFKKKSSQHKLTICRPNVLLNASANSEEGAATKSLAHSERTCSNSKLNQIVNK